MEENRITDKFAEMDLHEIKKVWPEDPSSKAMWSSWERHSQRRARLTVIWILADAFFKKCGYELLPEKKPANSKTQCVYRNLQRLQEEAQISAQELRSFMRLSIVANFFKKKCLVATRKPNSPARRLLAIWLVICRKRSARIRIQILNPSYIKCLLGSAGSQSKPLWTTRTIGLSPETGFMIPRADIGGKNWGYRIWPTTGSIKMNSLGQFLASL